jgi:hypothetical protein
LVASFFASKLATFALKNLSVSCLKELIWTLPLVNLFVQVDLKPKPTNVVHHGFLLNCGFRFLH